MQTTVLVILGTSALIYFIFTESIDWASRFEYMESHFPRLVALAHRNKGWRIVAILVAMALLGRAVYDLEKANTRRLPPATVQEPTASKPEKSPVSTTAPSQESPSNDVSHLKPKQRPRPSETGGAPLIPPGSHIEQGKNAPGSTNVIGNNNQIGNDLARPIVTYSPNGMTTTVGPSGIVFGGPGEPTNKAYNNLISLEDQNDWRNLALLAESQIKSTPTWLTPYAFSGEAYVHLNQPAKAIERLDYFIKEASASHEYDQLVRIAIGIRQAARESAGK